MVNEGPAFMVGSTWQQLSQRRHAGQKVVPCSCTPYNARGILEDTKVVIAHDM